MHGAGRSTSLKRSGVVTAPRSVQTKHDLNDSEIIRSEKKAHPKRRTALYVAKSWCLHMVTVKFVAMNVP